MIQYISIYMDNKEKNDSSSDKPSDGFGKDTSDEGISQDGFGKDTSDDGDEHS